MVVPQPERPPVVVPQPERPRAIGFDYLQPPRQLIENYFTKHSLFGVGKEIVDLKSFHLRYVNNVYTHLKNVHLNPEIAEKFLQLCFGKYIDLAELQAYITALPIRKFCKKVENQNALAFAAMSDLVKLISNDSILPKIKISDSIGEFGIPQFDTYIEHNGGRLNHVENAILAYNNFVDSLDAHVMESITSNEIDGQPEFDADNASLQYYKDIILIDAEDELDKILLNGLNEGTLRLNVICYNFNDQICDWYIHRDTYNALKNNDDKKKAIQIARACYLYRYALLAKPLNQDKQKSFREIYLRKARLAIEGDALYAKQVDLAMLARLRINSNTALYSVEPLRMVTQNINRTISSMPESSFKNYFKKLIFRLIHLSMSPKINGILTAKKQGVFGTSINTQELEEYEIDNWLREYHRNKDAHNGSFGSAAFADTDYFDEGQQNEWTLVGHLQTAITNIRNDNFNSAGIYYSSEIIRFVAAKLEQSILYLENTPILTEQGSGMLEDLSITLGMFLQGLHHCPNGRIEVISKVFPRLMDAADIRALNTSQMLNIILKLAASDIIADTLQFHNNIENNNQRTQLAGENATFFAATLRLLEGNFGVTVGAGEIFNWLFGTNLLKNYLEKNRPEIWRALPRQTQLTLSRDPSPDLTTEIVMNIMNTAMSPTRLIEHLIHERNVGTTDLLIQKYLDERGIRGYNFSTSARRKQIIADILQSKNVLNTIELL